MTLRETDWWRMRCRSRACNQFVIGRASAFLQYSLPLGASYRGKRMFARFNLSALSRDRSTKFVLAVLVVVSIALVALTTRACIVLEPKIATPTADVSPSQSAAPVPKPGYLKRGQFPSHLREVLKKLGDRLEKPGKERLILSGKISRPNLSGIENPFRLILELPNRLRLEEQENGKVKVTVFDGKELQKIGDALKDSDKVEIYSLIFDSIDQFFIGQSEGESAARFLGYGFKMNNLGTTVSATDSRDIYQLAARSSTGALAGIGGAQNQRNYKLFHFNSRTLLLEGITYKEGRNGTPVQVAVALSNWRKIIDQQIPGQITRLEDMKPVFILKIDSATINRKENDGIFAIGNL